MLVELNIKFMKQVLSGFHFEWTSLFTPRGLLLKAEPGKLDIKRREPSILFISLPTLSLFKLGIMT